MRFLETAQNDRIDPQIFFVDIALYPIGGVRSKTVLFTVCANPVIHDVIDLVVITNTDSEPMNLIESISASATCAT